MPTNAIRIQRATDSSIKAEVWDASGTKHDVTDSFSKISGSTSPGSIWNKIKLHKGEGNSVMVEVNFEAAQKDLRFEVPAGVIAQILTFHEG